MLVTSVILMLGLGIAYSLKRIPFERYMNEEEKDLSVKANGLVPKKEPHHKNSKWIAYEGTRDHTKGKDLGKAENYTHKVIFTVSNGIDDIPVETKDNEPGSFAIPADQIEEFNSRVIDTKAERIREAGKQRRKGQKRKK